MTALGSWDRIALDQLASLFGGVSAPWWLAGGYAVELAVGSLSLLQPDHRWLRRLH